MQMDERNRLEAIIMQKDATIAELEKRIRFLKEELMLLMQEKGTDEA